MLYHEPTTRLTDPTDQGMRFEELSVGQTAVISETITDPVRRDQLKSHAERLNPDTWVTDEEVSAGLEAYETVFESLRTVVGRRRRRRRRSGRNRGAGPTASGPQPSVPDSAGGEEADPNDTGEDL